MKAVLLAAALAYNVTVPATVKTSLCGDGIIEGPEECEGADLNDSSCASLGFTSGSLSCDSACGFDKSDCVTVSPSPSPSPSPNPSSSPAAASPAAASTTTTAAASPSLVSQLVNKIFPKAVTIPSTLNRFDNDGSGKIEKREMAEAVKQWVEGWHLAIAGKLANLPKDDLPKPGASKLAALLSGEKTTETGEEIKIEAGEVRELEVFSGRVAVSDEDLKHCDLSGDKDCSLIDLSILLYFITGS